MPWFAINNGMRCSGVSRISFGGGVQNFFRKMGIFAHWRIEGGGARGPWPLPLKLVKV